MAPGKCKTGNVGSKCFVPGRAGRIYIYGIGYNTAGHLTWTNNMALTGTNANNAPLTVQGPNGHIYEIGAAEPVGPSSGPFHLNLGTQAQTTATSGREYTGNVTNFAPGEYVVFMATITNNGTVGFMVASHTPTFKTSSNPTYNAAHKSINAAQVSASSFSTVPQLFMTPVWFINIYLKI